MKLNEVHKDIDRYLAEDCYCPNEVYSMDGIFFEYVFGDAECKVIGTWHREEYDVTLVITASGSKREHPILLNIAHIDEKVLDMERYEYTEDNLRNMVRYWNDEIDHMMLSETKDLSKSLKEIMSIADAVLID